MNNYKRIIREEINKLILYEAIDVSPLSKYIQPLQKCVSDLRNIGYSNNKEVDAFLKDICEYILQVIFGVDRCVKANSLNEDFRLSDYGVQYPAELGGNLWNDFENGLYKGANWARTQLYKRGYLDGGNAANGKPNGNTNVNDPNNVPSVKLANGSPNGNTNGNTNTNNPNNVPSVKLADSLRNLSQISLRYQDLTNKYPNEMSQYSNIIYDALGNYISNLNREYNQIKANAQGNP